MRKRLLERKPLLVKIRARTPQLQGDLPSRLFSAADDRHDLLETLFVVRLQDLDAGGRVGERPAVGRENQVRFVGCEPAEAVEIFMQRVGRALWMKADVRRELGKHVVAGEKEPVLSIVKADVPR